MTIEWCSTCGATRDVSKQDYMTRCEPEGPCEWEIGLVQVMGSHTFDKIKIDMTLPPVYRYWSKCEEVNKYYTILANYSVPLKTRNLRQAIDWYLEDTKANLRPSIQQHTVYGLEDSSRPSLVGVLTHTVDLFDVMKRG